MVRFYKGIWGGWLLLLLSAATGPAGVAAQAAHRPLTKDQTVQLLRGDVPPARVAELAREQGIDFQMRPEIESDLRQAGATDELISTLRELAPKPAAPPTLEVVSIPGGAQVYVDDSLMARTSPQGLLRISTLPPGDHRLRVSLDGYDDFESKVSLGEGKTETILAKLNSHAATGLEIQTFPGHAQVYLDDTFSGATSEQGQLRIPSLAPGRHRLRITGDGYQEDDRQIDLTAGQTLQVSANLVKIQATPAPAAPAPAVPAPAPAPLQWRVYSKVGGMSYEKGLLTLNSGTLSFQPDDSRHPFRFQLTDVARAFQTMGDLSTRYDLHITLRSGLRYELITLDGAGHGVTGKQFVDQMISLINQAQGR
jgi:PEGA domain